MFQNGFKKKTVNKSNETSRELTLRSAVFLSDIQAAASEGPQPCMIPA